MKDYSIVRIGDEYIVQADEKSILKITSRRRAAKLVTQAADLLHALPAATSPSPETHTGVSAAPDPGVIPDPDEAA
jgi:hypothetical protein